ncbi:MAG: cytochrome P450 [Solirubrobacterales bacterium]|nr:cytochrome P450 [Solirubrobacterales bacterium]
MLFGRFLLQPTSSLDDCQRRYGDYFTLRLPNRTTVLSSDPEAVKTVFTADSEHLLAGRSNAILQPLLGDRSVLLLDGREHLRQRRLLLPPFHGERMQAYAETMREVAEREVASWQRGRPFAVQPSMQAITLEVILRTVFGISGEERVERIGAGASFALFEMRIVLQAILDRVELRPDLSRGERVGRRSITLVPKRGGRIAVGAV